MSGKSGIEADGGNFSSLDETRTSKTLLSSTLSTNNKLDLLPIIHDITLPQTKTYGNPYQAPPVMGSEPPKEYMQTNRFSGSSNNQDDFAATSFSGSGFSGFGFSGSGSGHSSEIIQTSSFSGSGKSPDTLTWIPHFESASGSGFISYTENYVPFPTWTYVYIKRTTPKRLQNVIQDRKPILPTMLYYRPKLLARLPSKVLHFSPQESVPIYLDPDLGNTTATDIHDNNFNELDNVNTSLAKILTPSYNPTGTMILDSTLKNSSELCGFPGFCSVEAQKTCAGTLLSHCDECSMAGAALFALVAILLGVLIMLGNAIVIRSALKTSKKGKNFFSKIKCSLALADMLTGIEILCVAMYNFSWTINSTAKEIDHRQLQFRGSTRAVVGGIFYLLGFTSSLYHLVFLGGQRLYAIWRPVKYKLQPTRVVYIGLAAVWAFALGIATIPLWIPDVFTFSYIHTIFLFAVAISDIQPTPKRFAEAMAIPVVTILAPFIFMTILTGFTAVLAKRQIRKRRNLQENLGRLQNSNAEMNLFRTVAYMQIGFTVTLVPVLVPTVLSYTYGLTCDNVSLPFLICFYMSMSNSLVNVVVYSVRDAGFRSTIREMFCFKLRLPSRSTKSQTTRLTHQKESERTTSPV